MNSDPTTRKSMSGGWHFLTLAHVWDDQTKAIIAGADKLETLSAADRTRSLAMLSERVRAHIRGLDDSRLVATASFILNYVIDNTESEADLGEMLTYLPGVFRAAGLLVVGPQLVALEIMEQLDHRSRDVAAI